MKSGKFLLVRTHLERTDSFTQFHCIFSFCLLPICNDQADLLSSGSPPSLHCKQLAVSKLKCSVNACASPLMFKVIDCVFESVQAASKWNRECCLRAIEHKPDLRGPRTYLECPSNIFNKGFHLDKVFLVNTAGRIYKKSNICRGFTLFCWFCNKNTESIKTFTYGGWNQSKPFVYLYFVDVTYHLIFKPIEFISETFDFISETFDFISETFDFISQIFDFMSVTFELISETFNLIFETFELISETFEFIS